VRGDPLLQAHRDHLYQRLARRIGHVGSTIIVGFATLACLGAAVLAQQASIGLAVVLVVLALATYWIVSDPEVAVS
jgi:hypothetical protein